MLMQRVVSGERIRAADHNAVVETVQRLHGIKEGEDIGPSGSRYGVDPHFGDVAYVNDMAVELGWAEADETGVGREMVAVQIADESTLKSALGVDEIFAVDKDYGSESGALEPKRYHFDDTVDVTPYRPNGKSGGAFDGWMALPIRSVDSAGLHGFKVTYEALDDEGEQKPMKGYCFSNTAGADDVKAKLKAALNSYFKVGPEVAYDRAWCYVTNPGSAPATGEKGAWTTGARIIQHGFATVEEKQPKRAFDIEWRDDQEDPDTGEVVEGGWYFVRCYWQEGGITRHNADLKLVKDDEESSGSSESSSEDQKKIGSGAFLCLRKRLYGEGEANSGGEKEKDVEFRKYASLEALQDAQRDDQYYIVPLYVTTDSTAPADWTDLRTKPEMQMFDMIG